jgi:hypothetical protein
MKQCPPLSIWLQETCGERGFFVSEAPERRSILLTPQLLLVDVTAGKVRRLNQVAAPSNGKCGATVAPKVQKVGRTSSLRVQEYLEVQRSEVSRIPR